MTIDCIDRLRGSRSRVCTEEELEIIMNISVADVHHQPPEIREMPFYSYPSSARSDARQIKMVQHLYRLRYALQNRLLQSPSQPTTSTQ